jgi:hypothetical protein
VNQFQHFQGEVTGSSRLSDKSPAGVISPRAQVFFAMRDEDGMEHHPHDWIGYLSGMREVCAYS